MPTERTTRRELAAWARDRLVESLDQALGERLRPDPAQRKVAYEDLVIVTSFVLGERCARRAAHPADDFAETSRTARRRVGLAALRRLGDDASPATQVAAAVTEVIEERVELARTLSDWIEALDPAGRAALAAASITWAESVRRVVGRDPASVPWSDASMAPSWDVPERRVRLKAAHEALHGGVVSGEVLLLVADGPDLVGQRRAAAHLALVRSLGVQHAPVRITMASPSTGQLERVEVDRDLLALGVDRVTEHVALVAEPERAPTTPGRWCRWCHLLELCPAGTAWVDAASVASPPE